MKLPLREIQSLPCPRFDMQKFTLHCHTNALGCFDGKSTAEEMIKRAEEMGFETIGISNHLIWHPNVSGPSPMFFNDWNKTFEAQLRIKDEVQEAASKSKIKVLFGAEADFFPSAQWRDGFEKLITKIDYDYLIATTHFIRTADEKLMCNIYHLHELPLDLKPEDFKGMVRQHWQNIVASIESGYYNFLAHPDYCVVKIPDIPEFNDYRWQIIETLDKYKFPFEVNTKGFNLIGIQHPTTWMLKELCKRNVPTLLSDDSHHTSQIGQHFEKAEQLLKECGCHNRWNMDSLNK